MERELGERERERERERETYLFMKLNIRLIGKYPENTVMAFDSCNNKRGCPFLVC